MKLAPRAVAAALSLSSLVGFETASRAQSAPPAVVLPLREALERAERTVPDLLTAESAIRQAEATRVGAGIRLPTNPRINIDGRRAIEGVPRRPFGWSASAEIAFEVANAAGARIDEAARRVEVARSEFRVSRLEARLMVFQAYVSAKLGAIRVEQTRHALDIAERLKVVARERLSAGAGSEIEITSADVEVAESRRASNEAEATRAEAEQGLRFLLALPREQPLTLPDAIDHPAAAPAFAALMDAAMKNRPDLQVIRDRIELLAASDVRLGREAQPKVGLFGGLDVSPDSPRFGMAGLSVELPVAQRNQGPRAVAAAERQTELTRLDVERRRTDYAIDVTRSLYEARRAQLGVLENEGVPAAERRLALVEQGWRSGRFDVQRVTSAARDMVRLRESWGATLAELWQERIELERLVGKWPE
jgi:outer membrane protein, heavy metal efflux system